MLAWLILALVIVFILVLIVRTLRFKPVPQKEVPDVPVELNEEKIVRDMQDMIRCKTVSNRDPARMDMAEFEKFQNLLAERFPLIHEKTTHRSAVSPARQEP